MHLDDLWALGASASREELRGRLLALMEELGFERFTVVLLTNTNPTDPAVDWIHNVPAGFSEAWNDMDVAKRCPVMGHLKRTHVPIIYDQSTYVAVDLGPRWEVQARFGFAAGVASALHLPSGQHIAYGVDRDRRVQSDPAERMRLATAVHTIAAHCVDPVLRHLSDPVVRAEETPRLTSRERQMLQWTALGKSASMVSEITNLSFSTVNFHLRNATHKLGCNNKHVAACRAQALGLIST
jgi:DNA-binding CsgD family transcriptional regulator